MVSNRGQSKNVCVIGAGPSGLVAARELRKEGHTAVVLEQNHDIGGQWLYEPNVESEDPLGKNKFPQKDRDTRRYPGHKEFWLYLKDFCEWFGLRDMVRFNTRVEYVGMLDYDEFGKDLKWLVKSKEKTTEKVVEEVFDAVVVANGHYSHPRLPSIKGMDEWKRKQMHSHIYRVPEPFRNEVVVIVGINQSGQDIAMETVEVAKEVHLSARSLDVIEGLSKVISKHHNMYLHPQIESLHEDGMVQFEDGSSVIGDAIIYCTG
ncbi:hypothetical protein PTKIN_Ptkin05aG0175700 [Pterospermum kingtungense]